MSGSYNKIILIGNLGRDPETRSLPSGTPVATFSVATSERRRGQDGQQQEHTTWFRVNAFDKLAETCSQYLHKGSYVYIEGALSQQEYTDREGQPRTSLEVRAREMRMLDKVGDSGASSDAWTPAQPAAATNGAGQRRAAPAPSIDAGAMDDIPF